MLDLLYDDDVTICFTLNVLEALYDTIQSSICVSGMTNDCITSQGIMIYLHISYLDFIVYFYFVLIKNKNRTVDELQISIIKVWIYEYIQR